MRYLILIILGTVLLSCNDSLNIEQKYGFDLETMPVPKKIVLGETVEIRCQILREGKYNGTKFYIRYFQNDGKGSLRLNDVKFQPNDLYHLDDEVFRLYYTSESTEQQTIYIYIEDSFGQVIQKTFTFTDDSGQKNEN